MAMIGFYIILCHLIGDYVLQSHVMATKKTSGIVWATIHGAFYSVPYCALLGVIGGYTLQSALAWAVIMWSHVLIDRYAIARKWCVWWGVGHPGLWHKKGMPFESPPPFLGVWLQIIVDNTLHLAINGACVAMLLEVQWR